MTEQTHIGEGIEEAGTIDTENERIARTQCQRVQPECQKGNDCKRQDKRRVKGKDDSAFFHETNSISKDDHNSGKQYTTFSGVLQGMTSANDCFRIILIKSDRIDEHIFLLKTLEVIG